MNRLPATFVEAAEADALAVARKWIAWACDHPHGIFHPNATTHYGISFMKDWARWASFGDDDVFYLAENGNREAHIALCELIDEYHERGEPLTAVLTVYSKRLTNPYRAPKKRGGTGRAENLLRDFGIMMLVVHLRGQYELPLYQGKRIGRKGKLKPPSISNIAARALTEARINMPLGYKNVERIFDRYFPALAGTKWAEGTRFGSVASGIGYRIYG